MTRQKPKEKFLSFFELLEALEKPRCPICTLIEKYGDRYLDGLLWEQVNDGQSRRELRGSQGFCNWHAWKALRMSDSALGLAIIYEDLLRVLEEGLGRLQERFPVPRPFLQKYLRRSKPSKVSSWLEPAHPCPICRVVQFFEAMFLEILVDFLDEPEIQRKFPHSAGLCYPHLVETLKRFPHHEKLPLLIRGELGTIGTLRKELAEFIRKHDYQYAAEPMGPESDSWKRAVEFLVGQSGVFPNQMPRSPGAKGKPTSGRIGRLPSGRSHQAWADYCAQLEQEVACLKDLLKKANRYGTLTPEKKSTDRGRKN